MLASLTGFLRIGDSLVRAARKRDVACFADEFRRTQLYFLSLPPGFADGIESAGITPEELVAYVAKAAADLASRKEFAPFDYVLEGRRTVPIFTQEAHASTFVQDFVRAKRRIIPFQVLGITGDALLPMIAGDARILLNPGTRQECELSEAQASALRNAAGRRTRG